MTTETRTRVYYPYSNFNNERPVCSDVNCWHPAKFQFIGPYVYIHPVKSETWRAIYFVCGVHRKNPLAVTPSGPAQAALWREHGAPIPLDLSAYHVVTYPEKGERLD